MLLQHDGMIDRQGQVHGLVESIELLSVFSDLGDGEQAHDTREEQDADHQEEAELQLDLERRADTRNPALDRLKITAKGPQKPDRDPSYRRHVQPTCQSETPRQNGP